MAQDVQPARTLKPHTIWQDGQQPEPCAIVIFGATGDLTQRKLLPTLAHLFHAHPLPHGFSIVAFARRPMDDDQWRTMALHSIGEFMPEDDKLDDAAKKSSPIIYITVRPTLMIRKAIKNLPACSKSSTMKKALKAIVCSTWQHHQPLIPKLFSS